MIGNLEDRFSLKGMVGLVTGGGQGLGGAIALGLAQHGAKVAVVDMNVDSAESIVDRINSSGGQALAIKCDVSQEDQAVETVAKAIAELGKIDVVVANAGIGDRNPAEEMTIEQWDRVMAVNLRGVWLFDQVVGKHMIERGEGGSIINMASVAAEVGLLTGNANYSASKGGVVSLTRALAVEWGRFSIRVNAIAPVQFRTPLIANLIRKKPDTEQYFLNRIPIGRIGELEDIVGPAVFLASKASAMVSGLTLKVDGACTVAF